jgi:hypothetical protein
MFNMGLAYICKKFDVILHQFPDDLERTFFYIIGQLVPEKDDGVGHFLPAVNVFNMGLPEDIQRRLCLTWAYICKKTFNSFLNKTIRRSSKQSTYMYLYFIL